MVYLSLDPGTWHQGVYTGHPECLPWVSRGGAGVFYIKTVTLAWTPGHGTRGCIPDIRNPSLGCPGGAQGFLAVLLTVNNVVMVHRGRWLA